MHVFTHPKVLEYGSSMHPENAGRIVLVKQALKGDHTIKDINTDININKYINKCHTSSHLARLKNNSFTDPDTPNYPDIFEFAYLSAQIAVRTAESSLKRPSCALTRPPGHHAGRDSIEGFCYLNNICIAAQFLLDTKKLSSIAILDIDVHHGNGTENIVADHPHIRYYSLYQRDLYPSTPLPTSKNIHHFPFDSGVAWHEYHHLLIQALTHIRQQPPDYLLISIGFDIYKNDPLSQTQLSLENIKKIGDNISQAPGKKSFFLEGGYSDTIGKCATNFFKAYAS